MEQWVAPTTERWSVGDDLTWLQLTLHDEGVLWSRAELLAWYEGGYTRLCAQAQATRQWRILDVPPRYSWTYMYDWEADFCQQGTARQIGYRGPSGSVYAYAWELEQAAGSPPLESGAVLCTQLWEYAYLPDGGTTDQYYTFALPRTHERAARVYWDNKALAPKSTRELDGTESFWWREQGEPWVWSRGTGTPSQFDLYQIVATDHQGYELQTPDHDQVLGLARELSGTRTYGWVTDDGAGVPYGFMREIVSPERQYLAQPSWDIPLGTVRQWHTSVQSVMLWEVTRPEPDLQEADTPTLVPASLQKYLRAYVLWQAFARQGEGQRLDLAAWFEQRFQRGVVLMTRLGWVTRRDRAYQRQPVSLQGRAVPRPRLPSTFPRGVGV